MRVLRLLVAMSAIVLLLVPAAVAGARPQAPAGAGAVCTLVGTPGDDLLVGTPGDDVICGLGGDDDIRAGDGDDIVYAGPGDDRVYGMNGADEVHGGDGDDHLQGDAGADLVSGGAGDDVAWGGPGADTVWGGSGDDELRGGRGPDVLRGGPGDDVVFGDADDDELFGGPGDDVLRGGPGDDLHVGGRGTDLCNGGAGFDTARTCERMLNIQRSDALVDVQLLALNDFHGNLEPGTFGPDRAPAGGVEFLASHVRALEATNPNTLVVSAGDLIGASPLLSALFHDEPTIEAMNLLGLDLNAVGNHEFDDGADELLRLAQGGCHPTDGCFGDAEFAGADFEFLAANVVRDDTGDTLFPPYAVREFEGAKVAFIGMTLEGTPSIVTPAGVAGLSFLDEADTVNALVPELRARGIESIVVLLHEGALQTGDRNECTGVSGPLVDIVERLDDAVDAVVSGHTHQAYNCMLDGKLVTSASSFGRLLTDIDLTIDRATGDVVAKTAANLIVTNDVERDVRLTELLAGYRELSAPLANRVIGSVSADVTREANAAGESALGDVIADAQLAATSSPATGGAQIAFMNPGGIRADLLHAPAKSEQPGEVTYEEAFTVQPFGNSLVTMTLTGEQIHTLLEQQFVTQTDGSVRARVLQVSAGFSYRWDPDAPVGDRVDPADITLDGEVLDPAGRYRVTVNSFLAGGGDDFAVLTEGVDLLGGGLDLDAFEAYFLAQDDGTVDPGPQDRIRVE